jgi:hypothetical protein
MRTTDHAWITGAACLAAGLLALTGSATLAHAQTGDAPPGAAPAGTPSTSEAPTGTAPTTAQTTAAPTGEATAGAGAEANAGAEAKEGEAAEGEEKHEEVAKVGLDLVLGWGKVPFAVQNPPTGAVPSPTYTYNDKIPSNVQSFILGGGVEVVEHVEVGARLPFTFAGFSPNGSGGRSAMSLGNLELEGGYGQSVAPGLRLSGSLGVTLPTAQGTELPPDLLNALPANVDQSGYDRWSLSRAAARARGYEDNALFEPHRLGIIPRVALLYRTHGFSVEPYLKLENLIATSSDLANSYVGEFVGGLRVGYWVHKEFEVALRSWFNVGYAGGDEDKKTTVAIEPQVVLRFGPVRPYVGVIVPFTGPPNDGSFVGVRLGVDVAF